VKKVLNAELSVVIRPNLKPASVEIIEPGKLEVREILLFSVVFAPP
jgi:hypothetical protein